MLQISESIESFTQFQACLAVTFGGRSKLKKKTAPIDHQWRFPCLLYQRRLGSLNCPKNSQQRQNWVNQQATHISSLEAQNQKFFEPKLLVDAINQAVASNINIGWNNKPSSSSSGSGYTVKPYLEKSHQPQLAPGADGSLDPEFTCQYCKDTGHIKENCIKLN